MWLLEESLPIIIVAVIGGAVLAGAMLQTGRQIFLYILLGWIGVCSLLLAVESVIVTDGERIEGTLYDLAAALEANDLNAVQSYISNDAPDLKTQAEKQLGYVRIESVKVKQNLLVSIHRQFNPPIGVAKVNVVITGHLMNNEAMDGHFATYLVLSFQQDTDGQWRVVSYQFFDPRGEQAGEITPPLSTLAFTTS